jgi:UDP-N-acetylglucosamine 2-epimerase (non-hydrolysing)
MTPPITSKITVACIIGTRPEATKVAPLVLACRDHPALRAVLVDTGQHPDLVDGALEPFGLTPDVRLSLPREDGSLTELAGAAVAALGRCFREVRPDVVVVQGDTASTLTGALAAFWEHIPVVHLEAGLRSGDLAAPFPEEGNRRLIVPIVSLHLAPTSGAAANLVAEGVDPSTVLVVGNTSIDAALLLARGEHTATAGRWASRTVVVTAHRRESWGEPLTRIATAVAELARRHDDHLFIFPLHPNPTIRATVTPLLTGLDNVRLIEPLDYAPFVRLLRSSRLVITDSGGVQEEAPGLGIPVLVLRDVTERPEGIATGSARLVGSNPERIIESAHELLTEEPTWRAMAEAVNPYGDGHAAARAAQAVAAMFGADLSPEPFRVEPASV